MDDFYFIMRAGLVLAVLAGGMFWLGMFVGKIIWGGGEERAEEIERGNRKLEQERDSLRDPGMRSAVTRF